ncbi:MAG: nucleotidyl transferase AbiEii/AbiGii toxin family protein [Candidatus Sericytochromatia bacterium]
MTLKPRFSGSLAHKLNLITNLPPLRAAQCRLYRIQLSIYKEHFVLKGAMLFHLWLGQQELRVTRDVDLLSFGSDQPDLLKKIFIEICQTETDEPDGLNFDLDNLHVERIKEGQKYQGVRVTFTALLEKTRIPLQIDIGFGDVVTPAAEKQLFPVVLDGFSSPELWVYPKETVLAEKFQAIVSLGIQNTRMKDFFDLYLLSETMSFDGELVSKAVQSTFNKRETALPVDLPLAFTAAFSEEMLKIQQWNAFIRRIKQKIELSEVIERLISFLMPVSQYVAEDKSFKMVWQPNQGWVEKRE